MTDESQSDEKDDLVLAPPETVLRGAPVTAGGTGLCSRCNRQVKGGETVLVHAYRMNEDPKWLLSRVYCPDCEGELIGASLPIFGEGTETELLARANLIVNSGDGLSSYLGLAYVEVLARSPEPSHSERTAASEDTDDSHQERDA